MSTKDFSLRNNISIPVTFILNIVYHIVMASAILPILAEWFFKIALNIPAPIAPFTVEITGMLLVSLPALIVRRNFDVWFHYLPFLFIIGIVIEFCLSGLVLFYLGFMVYSDGIPGTLLTRCGLYPILRASIPMGLQTLFVYIRQTDD